MAGPFKMKENFDPFGIKAKKELKVRKQLDDATTQIEETSNKAKKLLTQYKEEDKPKDNRPSGTSKSYKAREKRREQERKNKESGPPSNVRYNHKDTDGNVEGEPKNNAYTPYQLPVGNFKKTKGEIKREKKS